MSEYNYLKKYFNTLKVKVDETSTDFVQILKIKRLLTELKSPSIQEGTSVTPSEESESDCSLNVSSLIF